MDDQSSQKPEILIVDDSKVIRKAATKMLGDGYVIHEAVDGRDGWQQIQQNSAISVIFTDVQMPVMDGIEALERIKSSHPELPVIMMTAYADSSAVERARQRGAEAVVFKPLDMPEVLSLIERVIRRTVTVR